MKMAIVSERMKPLKTQRWFYTAARNTAARNTATSPGRRPANSLGVRPMRTTSHTEQARPEYVCDRAVEPERGRDREIEEIERRVARALIDDAVDQGLGLDEPVPFDE
jgi:hypothetical protein